MTRHLTLLAICLLLGACAGTPAPQPPAPVAATPLPSGGGSGEEVLFRAIGLVGTPYRYGGNTPEGGFDCSGLIGYVYRDAAGLALPRSTRELMAMRVPGVSREALSSGDLVFFSTNGTGQVSHAGIYVGQGRFVHAPSTGGTVRLDSLTSGYWQARYLSARRVLPGGTLASHP